MTARFPVSAVACALALVACGGGSGDDGDDDPADARPSPDARVLDTCEALLEPHPDDLAQFEVIDTHHYLPKVPIAFTLDDCEVFEGRDLNRGGLYGHGFVPGDHTLRIYIDEAEAFSDSFSADAGDILWYGMAGSPEPEFFAERGSRFDEPSGWGLRMMNLSGGPISIEHLVDPDAPVAVYEPLALAMPHGETYRGDLPVDPDHGVWLRVTRGDDDVALDGNVMFFLSCDAGEWVGGVQAFLMVESNPAFAVPSIAIVYPGDPCAETAARHQPVRYSSDSSSEKPITSRVPS
jgi:hypothetical protein